ncbi:MAG TPA: 5'/3'-nucleotidase SurE [Acidobacteriaceae bacterium]|nr:5'/3'-nucleotidase SurE [Acidobacteriaceae bacterium]
MTEAGPLLERVLLTNDDGIDAPGLAVLADVARSIAREVWIAAPEHDQSGTSHSLSLHEPVRSSRQGERRFGVSGTPADCVVMAVRFLMGERPPDLILSGINRGTNLGIETVFSGTVGAAMTGMLLGIPSIALSQAFTAPNPVKWETARALAPEVIRRLVTTGWSPQACLSVNFPDVVAEEAGPLTPSRQGVGLVDSISVVSRTDPRGLDYHWLQFRRIPRGDAEDTETAILQQGGIPVTPLRFERTDDEALEKMKLDYGL